MSRVLFDHIAFGLPRMADALPFLVGELGGTPHGGAPAGVFRWAAWRYAGGGCLELIEPTGPDGFLHRFLARRGPSIHHVTFKVPDARQLCARAEAAGYEIVGFDDSDPEWIEAFLHPRQALGIVVQLAEARTPAEAGPPAPDSPPPATTRPRAAALGLRMRARTRERAQALWEALLGAECAAGDDSQLVFRWPGSPMRLWVDVEPDAPEGPVSVEVAGDGLSLPAGPHPVLGAVFAPRPYPADFPRE